MLAILPFFLLFIFPALGFVGIYLGGVWLWATPLVAFGLLPVLDFLAGETSARIETTDFGLDAANLIFWIYVPAQLILIGFGIARVHELPWVLAAVTVGSITGAIGITLAHELVHRREVRFNLLGQLLLAMVCYGHFAIEHVLGHHSHVATPKDPASARRGENVYRFMIRSFFGGLASAWDIEANRLKRKGQSSVSGSNRCLRTWSVSVAFAVASLFFGGIQGLGFFLLQSLIAIFLLELINYVEHYGLSRCI